MILDIKLRNLKKIIDIRRNFLFLSNIFFLNQSLPKYFQAKINLPIIIVWSNFLASPFYEGEF